MRFAKGHGTENDFVILVDPDGEQGLSPGLAARLCDRRAGIGADGVLRAVRVAALAPGTGIPGTGTGADGTGGTGADGTGGTGASVTGIGSAVGGNGSGSGPHPGLRAAPEWFMDYRNSDGSPAEMCGNGLRVFARYLAGQGLARGPAFTVATRCGHRRVRLGDDGSATAEMGAVTVLGPGTACGSRWGTPTWSAWWTRRWPVST
jgi:diaminopimelate epimerase